MTEVFGDRADFAIEAGVEPDLKPPSAVWGHMCVWCQGFPLGDITDGHSGLYSAYCGFRNLIGQFDALWAPEFEGLDEVSTWNFLDGLLYGYHGDLEVPDDRTAAECRTDWARWGRHNFLTNWDEPFDTLKAFILCPPSKPVRILYSNYPTYRVQHVEVSRASLLTAIDGFIHWFDDQIYQLRDQS